ncbi:MAG: type IV pilus assembly protein PilM [Desulfobacteraceae bacterium]|nr:type IV pilus assembly protein PilM [Desulfobacteraceae bacterium]
MALWKKEMRIVGLDIGSRTLKVAEAEETKNGFALKKFGMNDISPGLIEDGTIKSPEDVADSIRQLFKMYKIKEQNVAVSIGGYSIIVKPITVQTMPENQLQETIQFEAEQYIPFDISDVNLDFQILGEDESNPDQMNVLLVAAKKEIVTDYVNLVQMAGLIPRVMDVDAFALQNSYEMNYDTEDESVALIDIGANKTTLNILKGNISVLIRDVSFGCGQINQQIISRIDDSLSMEEAEELYHSGKEDAIPPKDMVEIVSTVVADWCAEIRRALDFFYQTYPGEHIRRIILSGGGANIQKFRELLAEETSSKVEIINPFDCFQVGSGFDPSYLDRVAPQAAICMGLSLRKVNDKYEKG